MRHRWTLIHEVGYDKLEECSVCLCQKQSDTSVRFPVSTTYFLFRDEIGQEDEPRCME